MRGQGGSTFLYQSYNFTTIRIWFSFPSGLVHRRHFGGRLKSPKGSSKSSWVKWQYFLFLWRNPFFSFLLPANLFLMFFPNIRIPLLAQCHHPNWSTGDNRVLGRPSLKRRRAVCRKSKRRKSTQNGKENEERTNIKEEGEEGVNCVNCEILRTPSLVEKQVVSKGSNIQKNKEEKVFLRTQEKEQSFYRVLGKPVDGQIAFKKKEKKVSRIRRSLDRKKNERAKKEKVSEEDSVVGPPVLVSVPLTLKVEVSWWATIVKFDRRFLFFS